MKKFLSFVVVMRVCASAWAVESSRRSMATQYIGAAPRVVQPSAMNGITTDTASNQPIVATEPQPAVIVNRDKEKQRCINNNIGVGNTFVWASRYSNTNNYSSMVEDVANPENNVCFVKIELKSDDSKISVGDVAPVYYEMGRTITCGAWANEGQLRQRILDAKKNVRTWGTVAGAVGGAGVGVGAMELFGNRLIGGSVMGQKALSEDDLLRSQVLALKEKSPSEYNQFRTQLQILQTECEKSIWNDAGAPAKPDECTAIDYKTLLMI